jgi:hypothetical protein
MPAHRSFEIEDAPGLAADRVRYTREALAEQLEDLGTEDPQELVPGAVVEDGEGFGGEVQVGRVGDERHVELSRALSQQPSDL